MYDLVIKGGRVLDPAENMDGNLDVAISGGLISKVGKDIPEKESHQVVSARGMLVTPGLIDVHTHVCDGIVRNGASPDAAGVMQGVTTVADGGSAGQAIFGGFTKYVIPNVRTTVFCFLHICSFGLSVMPELWSRQDIDTGATEKVIAENAGLIKGVKLRLVGGLVASHGAEVMRLTRDTARRFKLPVMVHIGDPDKLVPEEVTRVALPMMEEGDILSHIYTHQQGRVLLPNGSLMPEFREAVKRGVVLDIAHGRNNFSFEVAERMLAQGILPTTISSDVGAQSIGGPVYGLTVTMSKMMALGLSLRDIITMTTINPARALKIHDRKGSLKPGMDADVSILEVASGRWRLVDSEKKVKETDKLIVPRITVKSGQVIRAGPVAEPEVLN